MGERKVSETLTNKNLSHSEPHRNRRIQKILTNPPTLIRWCEIGRNVKFLQTLQYKKRPPRIEPGGHSFFFRIVEGIYSFMAISLVQQANLPKPAELSQSCLPLSLQHNTLQFLQQLLGLCVPDLTQLLELDLRH
jgi:hypothetical protein